MSSAWLLSQPSNAGSRQQCTLYCCVHALPWCMQIYPITMASWIFGRKQPSAVNAQAVLHKSGVDVTNVVNLK